jgi:hypothetical protein
LCTFTDIGSDAERSTTWICTGTGLATAHASNIQPLLWRLLMDSRFVAGFGCAPKVALAKCVDGDKLRGNLECVQGAKAAARTP